MAILGTDQQVITGVRKNLHEMQILYLGGKELTPTMLEDLIQARTEAATVLEAAKAAWLSAVVAYEIQSDATDVLLRDLKGLVTAAFGEESPKLRDFGYSPPKRGTMSEETKRAAAVKRAATRKANRAARLAK